MSCPTCSHTMESIGDHAAREMFLCPRCGTVKIRTYTGIPERHEEVMVPALVGRCRSFRDTLDVPGLGGNPAAALKIVWDKLGVAEAINTPEDRP